MCCLGEGGGASCQPDRRPPPLHRGILPDQRVTSAVIPVIEDHQALRAEYPIEMGASYRDLGGAAALGAGER